MQVNLTKAEIKWILENMDCFFNSYRIKEGNKWDSKNYHGFDIHEFALIKRLYIKITGD